MIKLFRHNMKVAMSAVCKQVQPLLNFPGPIDMNPFYRRKDKVVFVMGATGTGKSRLAIDLATHFPGEVINSDKMQVYKGLNIVTNKVTKEECREIPHHLLGFVDPDSDFTATDFRDHTSLALRYISRQDRVPIIAGGSNSFIEALVDGDPEFRSRHDCCFLWVDVSLSELCPFVSERVDRMVEAGLVDEVRSMYNPKADNTKGIRRAIGVGEMDDYFRVEATDADDKTKARFLEASITKIKDNTRLLARDQRKKICRLYNMWSWNMHRIDATEVFERRGSKEAADEAWERLVLRPSSMIVDRFLDEAPSTTIISPNMTATTAIAPPVPMAAVAAATH
ncbi:hypothetical protein ACJRO7_010317 [Eucalyptus globulus]|uniref:adenylate dimethylallyltransferase (ADP/ATP-dependent) n=1 Tax=Eucalyptus globulus TaxID=34317 RepID=A0ABD3LCR8_EUCGL